MEFLGCFTGVLLVRSHPVLLRGALRHEAAHRIAPEDGPRTTVGAVEALEALAHACEDKADDEERGVRLGESKEKQRRGEKEDSPIE